MPRLFVLLLSLLLAGCSLAKPPQDVADAGRLAFEQLRSSQDAALMARGTAELKTADPAVLDQMRATLPKGRLTGARTISWRVHYGASGHEAVVDHEYTFTDGVVIASTSLMRSGENVPWQVHGLHVSPMTKAVAADAGAFALKGKSPVQYVFLLAAIASPLLMIAAIITVLRTRGMRRKWLWCLLSLVGFGSLAMNWTTGEVFAQYLSIQIIGAGVVKNVSPLAPWILRMTIPVGAVLAILAARRAVAARRARENLFSA